MVRYSLSSGRHGCRRPIRSALVAAAFVLPALTPAVAQDGPVAVVPTLEGAGDVDQLFGTAPLPDADLAATTGREQNNWLSASSSNNAIVNGNHVGDNSVTGTVSLADSAFQNVSGVSMINFNTGNNSSINAAMSVNLQINYASPTP